MMMNMEDSFKTAQQFMEVIDNRIVEGIKIAMSQVPYFFDARVQKVNGRTIDVSLISTKNQILTNVTNKTGEILEIGDLVYIVCPHGKKNFNTMVAISTPKKMTSVDAKTIQGDLSMNKVNLTDMKTLDFDSITTKYLSVQGYNIAKTVNSVHSYTGQGNTANGSVNIPIPEQLKEILTGINYIVKFYPMESCNYSIYRYEDYFTITTDKVVCFGYEITVLM